MRSRSASEHTSSRRHNLMLFVFSMLLLFGIGEITGRLLERFAGYMPRRSATFLAANPFLRAALMPGVEYRTGQIVINVNSHGFRGPELQVPKPEGTFRIFAIGESSTFGWKGVASHVGAWPALLEKNLRSRYPERKIEVVNAGVPGYTSVEQRVNFMLRISRLEPDALVVYHGNNDIDWSWVPELDTKLIYGREVMEPVHESWNRVINHSYVYLELRSQFHHLVGRTREKYDEPDPAALAMLKRNLRGFIRDARGSGVKVAIATFAHGLDEDGKAGVFNSDEQALGVPAVGKWFQHLSPQGARLSYPRYNENVRALAAEERIPLADLARVVPATPEYHTDWCHLTAKGHEVVASVWAEVIARAGWVQPQHAVVESTPQRTAR